MKRINFKKLLLPNLPYVFLGLYASKLGQAWRLAPGLDLADRLRNIGTGLSAALASPFPSFHPSDLLIGLLCGAVLRLVVYMKGKNAKKYRHNMEYGTARWGTPEDIRPFVAPRFEDNIILTQTESLTIAGFQADIATLAAHPHPEKGFAGMVVRGDTLTDKDNAGAAILEACKEVKAGEPMEIGSYRGFQMSLSLESFGRDYILTLKGQMSHRVELGQDARGNLVRIDNALAAIPDRLRAAQAQLENLHQQLEAARAEVGKPFPLEAELREKSARLAELDVLLNIDGGRTAPEQVVAKGDRPSVLTKLKTTPPVCGAPDKTHKKEKEAR